VPTAQQRYNEILDLEDVSGKRIVQTRLQGNLTIREENTSAAPEAIGFAVLMILAISSVWSLPRLTGRPRIGF
jgi:hypothetical protein